MITGLSLRNFTVFAKADFEFASGLNVIAGENGTGKSHVLKVAYATDAVLARGARETTSLSPTKNYLESAVAGKLRGVLKPEGLGRLARRQQGVNRCEITARFSDEDQIGFLFNTKSTANVTILSVPQHWRNQPPVFVPTRELLSIFPSFIAINEDLDLPFEETWSDTCRLLEKPLAKGKRLDEIAELLRPMEGILEGKVILEGGRFYIKSEVGKLEVHLVAEGLRKIGMIAQSIANGSLVGQSSLFWDEPEANLNPKIIKQVAQTILRLCLLDVQVFIATHSLFLMRELEVLLKNKEFAGVATRFIGLHSKRSHSDHQGPLRVSRGVVKINQGETFYDMGEITSLQEELSQSDRFMDSERS